MLALRFAQMASKHGLWFTACDCLRCAHHWVSKLSRPARCPHCTSPQWDKPRTRETRKSNLELQREAVAKRKASVE